MVYSGAGGKLIHEKNQLQKISWHCPLKGRETPNIAVVAGGRRGKDDRKQKFLALLPGFILENKL
jgi:hypothetical protein